MTGVILGRNRVRRGIRSEKKGGLATGCRVAQCKPVPFALGNRQTVHMRPYAAGEQRVAVDHQVMRRDRGCDIVAIFPDEGDAFRRRDVFKDYF